MKISKLAIVPLVLILSACNSMPQKPAAEANVKPVQQPIINAEQGDALYAKKEYRQALAIYKGLHEKAPKDTHVLFRIANIYSHLKVHKLAIKHYELALNQDKHLTKAWYNLGVVHMKEAAKTWGNMSKYTNKDEPLAQSAEHYHLGLVALINPEKR